MKINTQKIVHINEILKKTTKSMEVMDITKKITSDDNTFVTESMDRLLKRHIIPSLQKQKSKKNKNACFFNDHMNIMNAIAEFYQKK